MEHSSSSRGKDRDSRRGGQSDHGRRRNQRREKKSDESKEEAPRVLLLRPKDSLGADITADQVKATSRSQSPQSFGVTSRRSSVEDKLEAKSYMISTTIKLLDHKSWSVCHNQASKVLQPNNYDFKVLSIIGPPASRKSSIMNKIAGSEVFPSHGSTKSPPKGILQHLTEGVDLFVTKSRMVLLDSQGLMSSSILDDFISGSLPMTSMSDSFTEADVLLITSMQIISFLVSVSDSLIITCKDGFLDTNFLQMLSTCISIMSSSPRQLNLIWYLTEKLKNDQVEDMKECLQTIFGRGNITVMNGDEDELKKKVLRVNTGRKAEVSNKFSSFSETSWLKSAQVFWDKLVRKPSLFLDYSSRSYK